MKKIEEIIRTHFSTENILNVYQIRLKKSVAKTFGTRSYQMDLHKQKDKKLVETDNFWFYDDRGKPKLYKTIFSLIPFVIFYYFFLRGRFFIFLEAVGAEMLIIFGLLIVLGTVSNIIRYKNGSDIKIFKKEFVQVEKIGNEIKLNVKLPKYSKYILSAYLKNSKILDKMGATVTSTKMEFNYIFETDPYNT